jgi:pimeloyl-ACP methyl ester carboxylesterase
MTAAWNWAEALPSLAGEFHVVAPDTPGHGMSANPRPDLQYADIARDVLELARSLGFSSAAFYGFSDGAQVALEVAIAEPRFPRALVLSGVLHRLGPGYQASVLEFAGGENFAAPLFSAAQPEVAARCQEVHADWAALAPQVWDLWMRDPDLPPERLAQVLAPVLLLTGDRDPFAPVEQTVQLFRLLPDVELAVVPGAGHDYDQRFTGAAREFLARRAPHGLGATGSLFT